MGMVLLGGEDYPIPSIKLAIFDKDGTITTTASGSSFVQHPENQTLLPGVTEGLRRMAADGYAFAIASNQGGIGAGHKTLAATVSEMNFCRNLLGEIRIPNIFFCPDLEGQECYQIASDGDVVPLHDLNLGSSLAGQNFRKPGAGMIIAAQAMQMLFVESVVFVGDHPEDEQAAIAAGVSFEWADEWRGRFT